MPDEALRAEAKAWLVPRLAQLAAKHGFTYNRVFIKNNVSNWGSCSTKGNINLNMQLMRLPEELRDYVILDSAIYREARVFIKRHWRR